MKVERGENKGAAAADGDAAESTFHTRSPARRSGSLCLLPPEGKDVIDLYDRVDVGTPIYIG